ncbi:MAG TPA: MbcA/ParS/Xre antitoxin family protein [Gemmatimonadaceae bacterium]|nr:MbcA/ParS/Xre antitoxin family protein [Gemmatimonadaceae bacterium]
MDAQRVAAYLDVPLKSLVDGLGGSYTAVHKTPTSDAVQEILGPVYNIVAILRSVFEGDDAKVRQWLRTPRAELRNQTPLAVMLQPNRIRAVDALVSQAWLGIPD